jgi:hypothetical protein
MIGLDMSSLLVTTSSFVSSIGGVYSRLQTWRGLMLVVLGRDQFGFMSRDLLKFKVSRTLNLILGDPG